MPAKHPLLYLIRLGEVPAFTLLELMLRPLFCFIVVPKITAVLIHHPHPTHSRLFAVSPRLHLLLCFFPFHHVGGGSGLMEKDREQDGPIRENHGSGSGLSLPSAVRAVPGLCGAAKSARHRAPRLAGPG